MTNTQKYDALVAEYNKMPADALIAAYAGWLKILANKATDEQYFMASMEARVAYDVMLTRMGGK